MEISEAIQINNGFKDWLDVEFYVEGQIVSETLIPIYELQE